MTYLYYRLKYELASVMTQWNFLPLSSYLRLVEIKASSRAELTAMFRKEMADVDSDVRKFLRSNQ